MKTEGDIIVPALVRGFVEEIEEHNPDHETVVSMPLSGRWRLLFEAGRVHLTVDFRMSAGSWKVRWAASELLVDGKPHEYVADGKALAALVADPDGQPEPWPMPEPTPIEEAPLLVARFFSDLTRRGGEDGIILGRQEDGSWMVGIDHEHGSIRLLFVQHQDEWKLPGHGLQLIIDGVDCTHRAAGDIEKALEMLTESRPRPEQPKKTGHDHTTVGSKANSVAVRRSTVIRV